MYLNMLDLQKFRDGTQKQTPEGTTQPHEETKIEESIA
jgi:hypothetical protein